jgi:hypothetical protein
MYSDLEASNAILDKQLHSKPTSRRHVTVMLPMDLIDELWQPHEYYIEPLGQNLSAVDSVKLHNSVLDLRQGRVEEPTEVWWSSHHRVLVVEHGRHRLANMRDMGFTHVPLSMSRNSLRQLAIDNQRMDLLSYSQRFLCFINSIRLRLLVKSIVVEKNR